MFAQPPPPDQELLAPSTPSQPSPSPLPPPTLPEDEELLSSRALLLLISLLFVTLWTSYYLQRHRIRIIHESVVAIILGSMVGLIVRATAAGPALGHLLSFKHTYFFNLLLPPIILNSGYELREGDFFGHLGPILTFAFGGTFLSIVVVGVLEYLLTLVGLSSLTFLECLMFGCILSSTDPVTVLAIFSQLKVDARLYSIIFGESILNDSVAIVMFSALNQIQQDMQNGMTTAGPAMQALHLLGVFVFVFLGSLAIGMTIGLATALLLKHSDLDRFPGVESCLVSLLAYAAFLGAQACGLSGIVSLLFAGITLKHYAYESLSRRAQLTTTYLFSTLSQLSENFIFIYLGITLFTQQAEGAFSVLVVALTLVAILIARYVSVFPVAAVINWFGRWRVRRSGTTTRPLHDVIPRNHQIMLWWAGLRGAVSFALALEVSSPTNAPMIQTTTLLIVIATVVIFGGTVPQALTHFNIKSQLVLDAQVAFDSDDGMPRLVPQPQAQTDEIPLFGGRTTAATARPRARTASAVVPVAPPVSRATLPAPSDSDDDADRRRLLRTASPAAARLAVTSDIEDDSESELPARVKARRAQGHAATVPDLGTPRSRQNAATATAARWGADQEEDDDDDEEEEDTDDGGWFVRIDRRYLKPMFSKRTAARANVPAWRRTPRRAWTPAWMGAGGGGAGGAAGSGGGGAGGVSW
ncbi:sodium/hydrogen exchanger 3 [Allomyces macrogynus ATCC 38327]|uniref:Sodium/hydrogen exchanger n=1 Tax=Allomyces macrogynus (strain ATCC 38327) TaxID=578462 RepID=A0A0L0SZ57_ALLM3|nr:sodium/hydrogen exchanger 3 [Allomyces macrogynus ATCC 38327]|eukprot:KNE67695.1 sodium/hydrogen exchanger 3 [Allomyces macrogynus ATCC 38327]